MKRIHKLAPSVVAQIAAGEVVERPASILKELLENSIDANADMIQVSILEGGIDQILVEDNGCGVSKDDLEGMIDHHATSKITKLEDLYSIFSFGFRGEALSSITSVSRVTIWSKIENEVGFEAVIDCGKVISITPKSRSQTGTSIKVERLFQSIPARKKFLKSVRTETSYLYRVFEDFTLAYPNISFQLTSNGHIYKKFIAQSAIERLSQVWPSSVTENLIPIQYQGQVIQVRGYLVHPHSSFSRLKYAKIYVQNRPIHSNLINKAVIDGYDTMLEVRKFPAYILKITLNPKHVDVNVHPRKMEVKFDDERLMYKTIRSLVSQSLQKSYVEAMTTPSPTESMSDPVKSPENRVFDPSQMKSYSSQVTKPHTKKIIIGNAQASYSVLNGAKKQQQSLVNIKQNSFINEANEKLPLGIYQILDMYVVVTHHDKVDIIDQHAAHEKILLEKLIGSHQVYTQGLISPFILEIQDEQKELFFEHIENIQEFVFRDFGAHTIILETVPTFLKDKPKSFFQELVDTVLLDQESFYQDNFTHNFYKTVACKAAVKAGDKLQLDEMKQLLIDLSQSQKAYTCCHGRPTIKTFNQKELDKLFSR